MKRRIVKLFSLITVMVLCVGMSIATTVFAATNETYSADNIFRASVGATYTAPENTEGDNYVTYKMGAESTVTYGRNLALKWYENGTAKYFTTTLSFGDVNFSEFTLKLEAAQHTMNKEAKSVNKLTFKSATQVSVNGDSDVTISVADEYVIALTENAVDSHAALDGTTGEYYVTVNGKYVGTFTNIGSVYAEYKSGSITPLTFSVDSMQADKDEQIVSIRDLNNQPLKLNSDGKVEDTAAPVFVLNDEIKVLELGATLSLDYKTIDVLDTSVSTQFFYSVYGKDTVDTAKTPEEDESGYTKADSLSKVIFFEDALQTDGNAYVSIVFRLTDGNNKNFYYLEDYATAVIKDTGKYVQVSQDVNSRPEYDTSKKSDYQTEVTAAALNADGKSIQIGSGANFYLPSLRSMISDDKCGYTELSFDIYYKNQTTESGSVTGLAYNELKFTVAIAGEYEFKVVATNKFGKTMLTSDGSEITSSNVWDENSIPSFTFSVANNGPSIEESSTSNDLGYIDVAFTFPSFEIVALSGYTSEYKLYRLTGDTTGVDVDKLNSNPSAYTWEEIAEYDSSKDDDEGDNVYEWRPSSRSFVPQKAGYYMITVTVKDSDGLTADAHQVVSVTSKVTTNRGETYWIRDNILSIVLMGIAGLCFIAIIVLLVIKPKDAEVVVSEKKTKKQALKEKRENRNK